MILVGNGNIINIFDSSNMMIAATTTAAAIIHAIIDLVM
jgi:hypothetical protein